MLLQVSDATKTYSQGGMALPVLQGVSLQLERGRSLALTGESGSGKSTLLHLVGGLDTPDGGSVRIDGDDISRMKEHERARLRRQKIGVIFQQFNLIPSLSVAANIAFQARLADRFDGDWVAYLTNALGLSSMVDRYPEQLSGGQQQRVAVARAIAGRPALLLADEPTGNLDQDTGDRVMDLMLDLAGQSGTALLMVTHSARLAGRLDCQVILKAGKIA